MPIKPVSGGEPLRLDGPDDVAVLMEALARPGTDLRWLGDHFVYLAGTRPEWFRPYQELVVDELMDRFGAGFGDMCLLFGGAPDRCVEVLVRRLRDQSSFFDAWALAAIGTDAALTAVADEVRAGADRQTYEDVGVWVPATGPAQYRFSRHRRAMLLRPVERDEDLAMADHPVGLRVEQVVADPLETPICWHYLSLRVADVPGLPAWPADRVHLVGAPAVCMWTIYATVDAQGRYQGATVVYDEPPDEDDEDEDEDYVAHDEGFGAVDLKPYDADLVYCNGHIQLTPGVVGTAGGPPLGIYANPSCPSCQRLMFHIATVEDNIREYGDGWRSMFVCEDCQTVACNATGWN